MNTLELLILVAGATHLGLLSAALMMPFVTDWRSQLAKLSKLLRQLFWVYGIFIFFTIAAFGVISLIFAETLAEGGSLARALCTVMATFWLLRLGVQFFVFDPQPYLTNGFRRIGYHALSVVFSYHVLVFALAAICPGTLNS